MAAAAKVVVEVEGRRLGLSNLDKVLYPEAGFTKAEVLDYYSRIAPVLLPHLQDRPLTRKRYPDGVAAASFFEKNAPSHTPEWVPTVTLPSPGSGKGRETIDYILCTDLATLVWLANLAVLELHTPMWRVGAPDTPDLLVVDLDPGPPATVVECAQVALAVRERLAAEGLAVLAKTSGSKGLQLYAPLRDGRTSAEVSQVARDLAVALARAEPARVVSSMRKDLRPGKVLLDWSQNNGAKTTVSAYSLRARPQPTVSTPVTWAEVEACRDPGELVFTAADVLDRVATHGDLLAPLLDT